MAAEIITGLGALKTAFDLAKGLKDIDDAARRNAAVIELQEKILSAQEAQASLSESIRALEAKVASFEKWDAEKGKYDLRCVGWGVYAFILKPEYREGKPPHHLCPKCFEDKKVSIIQHKSHGPDRGHFCPSCRTTFSFRVSPFSWDEYAP